MKWFPNYFNVQIKNKINFEDFSPNDLSKVVIINDNAEFISESLGISDERAYNLYLETRESFKAHDKIFSCIAEMSTKCKHPNELVMVVIVISDLKSSLNNPLNGLLNSFLKS